MKQKWTETLFLAMRGGVFAYRNMQMILTGNEKSASEADQYNLRSAKGTIRQ
jgi:hypothetical protein